MKVALQLLLLAAFVFACGKKRPDPAQEVRAFMADWERAIDTKNPTALDSLLTTADNAPPIDSRTFLAEIYNTNGIVRVNLVGRQLEIGDKQAMVTGRLVRSGLADSLATLDLSLLRTKKGWKLAGYQLRPFVPVKRDTAGLERTL